MTLIRTCQCFTLLPALLSVFTGCAKTNSSGVSQSQIYTSYELSYRYGGDGYGADAATAILKATATFNLAGATGTYLILDGTSGVALNGSAMTADQDFLNQVTYQYTKTGAQDADAAQAYAFVYTDNDGKTYPNSWRLPPVITVTNTAGATYPLTSALHVGWSTPSAVATSETLVVYVEKADGTYSVTSQAPSGGPATGTAGELVVSASSLQSATAGNAWISICRSRYGTPAQAPTAGGSLRLTRCSPKVAAVIQ